MYINTYINRYSITIVIVIVVVIVIAIAVKVELMDLGRAQACCLRPKQCKHSIHSSIGMGAHVVVWYVMDADECIEVSDSRTGES
jgi:hypothetical protein